MTNNEKDLKNDPKRCRAITNDGNRCHGYRLKGTDYCFQHYPKRQLLSQITVLIIGAVLGVVATQLHDLATISSEESLLLNRKIRSRNLRSITPFSKDSWKNMENISKQRQKDQ